MTDIGRTRLTGKTKGKAMEERVSMKAKEKELEAKEHSWSRTW